MTTTRVAIALGSNLGDRVENIENAIKLMATKGVKVLQTSHMYETAPMYYEDQGVFLNCACEVSMWTLYTFLPTHVS
jgi:2-amino-4-hydroxy-6-hydroxymethyldihydropteridine diphosphokinase